MNHLVPVVVPLVCAGRRRAREGPNPSSVSSCRKPVSSLDANDSQRNECSSTLDSAVNRSASREVLLERYT